SRTATKNSSTASTPGPAHPPNACHKERTSGDVGGPPPNPPGILSPKKRKVGLTHRKSGGAPETAPRTEPAPPIRAGGAPPAAPCRTASSRSVRLSPDRPSQTVLTKRPMRHHFVRAASSDGELHKLRHQFLSYTQSEHEQRRQLGAMGLAVAPSDEPEVIS